MNLRQNLISVAIASALAVTSAYAETPDSVKTRIGDLKFERDFRPRKPSKRSSTKSTTSAPCKPTCGPIRRFRSNPSGSGSSGTWESIYNDLIIADSFSGPEGLWLTSNDTTIYGMANVDLGKGPIVLEMPPGPIVGIIEDFWQRSSIDVGLPGPDGGKGGKFLILPPGYKGDVPQSGYFIVQRDDEQLQPHGPGHHPELG